MIKYTQIKKGNYYRHIDSDMLLCLVKWAKNIKTVRLEDSHFFDTDLTVVWEGSVNEFRHCFKYVSGEDIY